MFVPTQQNFGHEDWISISEVLLNIIFMLLWYLLLLFFFLDKLNQGRCEDRDGGPGNVMEVFQEQLAALERRLAQEKEEKDRLVTENERLSRGVTRETVTVRQEQSTTKVEIVYLPREKRCKVYTGKSTSVPLND